MSPGSLPNQESRFVCQRESDEDGGRTEENEEKSDRTMHAAIADSRMASCCRIPRA